MVTKVGTKPVGIGPTPDIGEAGVAQPIGALYAPRARPELSPGEEVASLPAPWGSPDVLFRPLYDFLGPMLTVANPAWGNDAVKHMRSLQKRLIAYSLEREEADRRNLMKAISTVEDAVRMRLRLEQMWMLDEDVTPSSGREEKP